MKKIFVFVFVFAFLCFSAGLVAQENNIILPEKPNRVAYKDYTLQNAGYWIAVEAYGGSMANFNKRNLQFAGIGVVNGYRFNEFLRLGLGLGIKYYLNSKDVRSSSINCSIPIYLDIRGDIISQESRTIVPFWSCDIGGEIHDGFFFSPTLGLRYGEKRNSTIFGIGFSYNQLNTLKKDKEGRLLLFAKIGYEF